MQAGALQALRLTIMLAGLALLLALTDRDRLIVGFYTFLKPFRHVGLAPERFAARLWLTLYYVEKPEQKQTPMAMFERLKDFHLEDNEKQPMTISLDTYVFGWMDYFALFVILSLVIALL